MGTSASYDAPPSWAGLKNEVTRAAHQGPLAGHKVRHIVQRLIHENGGKNAIARGGREAPGGAAGSAAPARDVAARLGNFVSDVQSFGLKEAAQRLGLGDLSNRPVGEILLAVLDRVGGPASTIDEADARQALSDLQEEILAEAQTVEEVESILIEAGQNLESLLERFFGHYIFEQFSRIFYERLVQRVGASEAASFIGQIKEFISSSLANRAATRDLSKVDWAGKEGASIVSEICAQTLEVFGA
jgi:hypothetical protein